MNNIFVGLLQNFEHLGQQYLEKTMEPGTNRLRSYVCRLCGRACNDFYAGKIHLETHFPVVGAYECEVCGKKYSKLRSFYEHKRKHRK